MLLWTVSSPRRVAVMSSGDGQHTVVIAIKNDKLCGDPHRSPLEIIMQTGGEGRTKNN